MRRVAWPLVVVAAVLSTSCGDTSECADCCDHPPCFPPPSVIENLTQRVHVLDNIETAYNKRRIDWYEGLLDASFVFYLSAGDVNHGLPENWNRTDEIDINSKLFDKNYATLPCQAIFVDIRTEDGVTWTESDSPVNPGEKWYSTHALLRLQV